VKDRESFLLSNAENSKIHTGIIKVLKKHKISRLFEDLTDVKGLFQNDPLKKKEKRFTLFRKIVPLFGNIKRIRSVEKLRRKVCPSPFPSP